MPVPEGPQFKEMHMVRGTPVRILSEQSLGDLVGTKAQVHMHTPATKELGKPVYSVLVGGKVVGQSDNIYLKNAQMKVNKRELENHLNNPTKAKTRNTFVEGVVRSATIEPVEQELKIRPGSMTDAQTGEDVSSGMGIVQLGSKGARYRKQ
jgi:hypothetical protein